MRAAPLAAALFCISPLRARVWTNSTMTPLERPAGLAGKEFFTGQEAREYDCNEGNYATSGILAGARAQEKSREKK